ncbi:MAG: hypothetical protein JNL43_01240 [Flavobacteriales bacterium]|nr:hypothetical protein [Flavobacteriales bacterium]
MARPSTLSLLLPVLCLAASPTFGQTLDYQWLNQPCADNLNCSNGCSACNLPAGATNTFVGANVIWSGLEVCPHPQVLGDNTIYTTGWPIVPDPTVFVGLTAASMESVQIDSIIIRHRRAADGPQRLQVQFTNDVMQVPTTLGEIEVTQTYQETAFSDLGCLVMDNTSQYSGFQLRLRAFQGAGGNWQLDAMRIVASPCNSSQVGIAENFQRQLQESGTYVDVLGRPVKGQPAPGVYVGGRKRVQVL